MNNQIVKNNSNNRLAVIILAALSLLVIPLVAMQFSKEVYWAVADFIIAGGLLLTTGLVLELILRNVKTTKQRIIFCMILFVVFFLIWAELAVGIFGSPFAGS